MGGRLLSASPIRWFHSPPRPDYTAGMPIRAATVEQYLAELPDERRAALSAVRQVFLDNVDSEIAEGMQYGMIGYFVPHSVYPNGYHCDPRQPLPFAGLASRKNHMSLHIYLDPRELAWFQSAWKKTGRKLDMGKSCIRFKRLEDVPLEILASALRRLSARKFIATYEAILRGAKPRAGAKASGRSPSVKTARQAAPSRKKPATQKAANSKTASKSARAGKSRARKGRSSQPQT